MEAQEMAIEEQRGIITRGVEEGLERALERSRIQLLQEGIQAGQRALILRMLERRVGAVNPDVVSRIGELSVEQLEILVEDLARFSGLSDLIVWLDRAE
jgi:Domain of unknown function (DUF4351)